MDAQPENVLPTDDSNGLFEGRPTRKAPCDCGCGQPMSFFIDTGECCDYQTAELRLGGLHEAMRIGYADTDMGRIFVMQPVLLDENDEIYAAAQVLPIPTEFWETLKAALGEEIESMFTDPAGKIMKPPKGFMDSNNDRLN